MAGTLVKSSIRLGGGMLDPEPLESRLNVRIGDPDGLVRDIFVVQHESLIEEPLSLVHTLALSH